jgi:hypothetical protein
MRNIENGPVEPGSARWQELVTLGIIKDGDRNWFLGDAALEIAPMGRDGAHNGAEANLRRYADEIGVEYSSLYVYRAVASAWSPVNRVTGTHWKVHQQLMKRKDLIRPGMTVTQAAAARGHKNVGRTGPQSDVAARAAAARDYLADPEVAKEVFRDPDTAGDAVRAAYAPLASAMLDHDQRQRDKAVPPGSAEEKTRQAEQQAYEVLDVMQRMHQLITATGRLAALGTLSREQVDLIVPLAQRAKVAVDYLAALDTSNASLEDELAKILEGEI